MAINIDAAAMEAQFANKTGAPAQPAPMQDLYAPGVRGSGPPTAQGQIPIGQPIPPGTVIQQVVGRGQPAIAVVPPKQPGAAPEPSMAVIPPQTSNRTSIGTFVEVSQTKSNPMTTAPAEIPSGISEPPAEPPPKPKRKKFDLTQAILDHIWELGGEHGEDCQRFYDRSPQAIKLWQQNPGRIPLEAINKFLAKRPGVPEMIQDDLEPHFSYNGDGGVTCLPNRGKLPVMICSPVLDRPTLPFQHLCEHLNKKYELGHITQADTMITRSRNVLAKRFLASNQDWSLWIDGDIAAPIGRPDWYRWITNSETIPDEVCNFEVLGRLLSHNKPIVGGVYASRRWHGQLVIQPEIHPRHHEDKLLCNDIRKGSARGLAAVDWIAFGCCLVHREVFLEVQRRFPDLAPQTEFSSWRFFDTQGDMGEDEAFCQRVRACSIPIWLDTQLICGHIGPMCFMPEHTQAAMAL